MQKITLNISGMHCASCAATIEITLKKEGGIKSANVNIATEKAIFEFDENLITAQKIKEKIEMLGYQATEELETSHDHHAMKNKTEIKKLKNRFVRSLILGLPIIYLVMGEMIGLPLPKIQEFYLIIIQFILATGVIIICFEIWKSGFKTLIRRQPDMNSLIFIGTAAAYFYSLVVFLSSIFMGNVSIMNLYFESAVFILIFISLGDYLEEVTKGKTSEAIKKLMKLESKEATVIRDNREIKIPIEQVKVDDVVLVKAGEKIPVDGIIIDGYASIDEKMITGESIPIEKKIGDQVIGATINKTGFIKFRATKVGKNTALSQIIKIVEESMNSKAPIQRLADKISFYFVPAVIGAAILAFILWLIFGQSFSFALKIFVAVLIVACPCALGLATPTAIIVGTGLAAKSGVLIKNGQSLELAQKINTIIFDKTGTLTQGEPQVTDIIEISEHKNNILKFAASIEKKSEHLLAQAILNYAAKQKIEPLEVQNFKVIPGQGVEAKIEDKKIILGTRNLMNDNNINLDMVDGKMKVLEDQGKTVMILAINQEIAGLIAVADSLKDYSRATIEKLQQLKEKIAIITGDNYRTAYAIGQQLGISKENIIAEVLPQEKSAEIKKLQMTGKKVAMVGDGINDAPALAQADLGIALGSGTDIAIETGEIILIKDDLRDVVKAILLSRYTLKKIKQNLFWAFFYNTISIPIAAGILYPFTGWTLNPAIAAAAMAFSSVSVVLNALLMKSYKPKSI